MVLPAYPSNPVTVLPEAADQDPAGGDRCPGEPSSVWKPGEADAFRQGVRDGRAVGGPLRADGSGFVSGRVNLEMVAEGWAWHCRAYSRDPRLADAELAARRNGLGLWADREPVPPWEFRRF